MDAFIDLLTKISRGIDGPMPIIAFAWRDRLARSLCTPRIGRRNREMSFPRSVRGSGSGSGRGSRSGSGRGSGSRVPPCQGVPPCQAFQTHENPISDT